MPAIAEFRGTSRFEIRRRLGAGGMGVVYETFDRERGQLVALKTLHVADPTAIQRFKGEFRALAEVAHPNLVSLYELAVAHGEVFFTMELVRGVDFIRHVRPTELHAASAATLPAATISNALAGERPSFEVLATAPPPKGALDVARLRHVLPQLVDAVLALHDAGKLHRDLKPSNVLVTEEGRAVLLDFGLVTDLRRAGPLVSLEQSISGTPEFMSPEQAFGAELTEASDWYAVGVILYEALTGALPFTGPPLRILQHKQLVDAPRASASGEVPPDLDELCAALLQREPEARPGGRRLLALLGGAKGSSKTRVITGRTQNTLTAPFVGREGHAAALDDAFHAIQAGSPVVVRVEGESGMGKSMLLRRFVDRLAAREGAVVLAGRCYEHDSVPYKAFDSVVDALAHHLARLPRAEANVLLPREIHALARVFPVLKRAEAVAAAPKRSAETPDPQELRRRAFAALKELLARIADRAPLVVWIDDLQWSDEDSPLLVSELLRGGDAPAMLLLASRRPDTEGAASSWFGEEGLAVRSLAVDPLQPADAEALARLLLGETEGADRFAAQIAQEAGGSPFYVQALVEYAQGAASLRRSLAARTIVRLDELLDARLVDVDPPTRRLLEIVAIAGSPTPRAVAEQAAELDDEAQRRALPMLRAEHFLRSVRQGERHLVVCYHDRVRQAVVGGLAPEVRAERHRKLAFSLEAHGGADVEQLLVHFNAAGEVEKAADYAIVAAGKAAAALAFDRAASLYRSALSLRDAHDEPSRQLRIALANALANAGRGEESAREFMLAAEGANVAQRLDAQRRAAEQLMRSGHIDAGIDVSRRVLDAVGMRWPETYRAALFSFIWRAIQVFFRGLRFEERDLSQVSAEDVMQIDVLWSVAGATFTVDTIRAKAFQKHMLLLSLRAGEPFRVTRALTTEVLASAARGTRYRRRTAAINKRAREIADRLGDPKALGFSLLAEGTAHFLEGDWRAAFQRCERSTATLRDHCTGVTWELATGQIFALMALWFLGETAELLRRVPALVAEAEARGDLYLVTCLRIGRLNGTWLVADEPARARQEVTEAMAAWSHGETHLQHYYELLALAQIDLYLGDGRAALERVDATWNRLASAFLFRVQSVRLDALFLRARAALACASGDHEATRLRRAVKDAKRILAEGATWAAPLARLILAAVDAREGHVARAMITLERAEHELEAAEMKLFLAAARHRRGELVGGAAGSALMAQARETMTSESVVDPARTTELLAPGFRPAPALAR